MASMEEQILSIPCLRPTFAHTSPPVAFPSIHAHTAIADNLNDTHTTQQTTDV